MLLEWLSLLLSWLATAHVAAYHLVTLLMLVLASVEVRRQRRGRSRETPRVAAASGELPGITLILPAFNEDLSLVRTIRLLQALPYPDLEILVVNDGSTDRTLAQAWDELDLAPVTRAPRSSLPTERVRGVYASSSDPRVLFVDKRNGGKADALNVGLNLAGKDLVCVVDADVVLDPDALAWLALPFVEEPHTVATSGMIRPLNGCRVEPSGSVTGLLPTRILESFQVLEYLRSYTVGRLFFNQVGAHLIISGAFGLFRRELLVELGGYQTHAIGEDMELIVRIHARLREQERPYRIHFVADALAFTEAPHSIGELGRQRTRWHLGLLTTLRLHRRLLLNPRFGAVGLLAFPYFVFLELLAPITETVGLLVLAALWAAGLLPVGGLLPFLLASTLLSALVSSMAVLLDAIAFRFFRLRSERLALLVLALAEPFGYHQLNAYFRLRAFPRYYRTIHIRAGWVPPARER